MEINYQRRLYLREKQSIPLANVYNFYLCISHLKESSLKGPYIIGFHTLEQVEAYSKNYEKKQYNVLVTFSYPFEISETWNKKNK